MTSLQCPFSSIPENPHQPTIIAITEMCSNLKPYIGRQTWEEKQHTEETKGTAAKKKKEIKVGK